MGLALSARHRCQSPSSQWGEATAVTSRRRLHALLAAVCLAFLGPSQTVLHRFYERVSQSL